MIERPIIFSGPMIRALLAGRKTQTRRIVKGVEECPHGYDVVRRFENSVIKLAGGGTVKCPYGVPGDRLWVRETFCHYDGQAIGYRADSEAGYRPSTGWRPAIHMPRAACRLVLEVIGMRVERLFDISEADCRAEGMLRQKWNTFPGHGWASDEGQPTSETARRAFEDLWYSINGAWLDCYVWVVSFKRAS